MTLDTFLASVVVGLTIIGGAFGFWAIIRSLWDGHEDDET